MGDFDVDGRLQFNNEKVRSVECNYIGVGPTAPLSSSSSSA
jgi:hypothetical protein